MLYYGVLLYVKLCFIHHNSYAFRKSVLFLVVVSSMALFFLGNVTRLKYPSSTSSHDIFEGFSGNLRVSGFLKNKLPQTARKISGFPNTSRFWGIGLVKISAPKIWRFPGHTKQCSSSSCGASWLQQDIVLPGRNLVTFLAEIIILST